MEKGRNFLAELHAAEVVLKAAAEPHTPAAAVAEAAPRGHQVIPEIESQIVSMEMDYEEFLNGEKGKAESRIKAPRMLELMEEVISQYPARTDPEQKTRERLLAAAARLKGLIETAKIVPGLPVTPSHFLSPRDYLATEGASPRDYIAYLKSMATKEVPIDWQGPAETLLLLIDSLARSPGAADPLYSGLLIFKPKLLEMLGLEEISVKPGNRVNISQHEIVVRDASSNMAAGYIIKVFTGCFRYKGPDDKYFRKAQVEVAS